MTLERNQDTAMAAAALDGSHDLTPSCLGCGYRLTGLAGAVTCPECGVSTAESFEAHRRLAAGARAAVATIGRALPLLSIGIVLEGVVFASLLVRALQSVPLVALLGCLGLVLHAVGMVAILAAVVSHGGERRLPALVCGVLFAIHPLAILATIVAWDSGASGSVGALGFLAIGAPRSIAPCLAYFLGRAVLASLLPGVRTRATWMAVSAIGSAICGTLLSALVAVMVVGSSTPVDEVVAFTLLAAFWLAETSVAVAALATSRAIRRAIGSTA